MIIKNGYIVAIEQSDENYEQLLIKINNAPTSSDDSQTYMLNAETFEWELVEIEQIDDDDELTAEEALAILTGETE